MESDPTQLREAAQHHRIITLAVLVIGTVLYALALWATWHYLLVEHRDVSPDPLTPRRLWPPS